MTFRSSSVSSDGNKDFCDLVVFSSLSSPSSDSESDSSLSCMSSRDTWSGTLLSGTAVGGGLLGPALAVLGRASALVVSTVGALNDLKVCVISFFIESTKYLNRGPVSALNRCSMQSWQSVFFQLEDSFFEQTAHLFLGVSPLLSLGSFLS